MANNPISELDRPFDLLSAGEKHGAAPKRSIRRHHRRRVIVRARRIYAPWGLADWAEQNHDHLKKCSCWMCGNPREFEGPPLQEKRLLLSASEEPDAT
jgi:hypothetical protein